MQQCIYNITTIEPEPQNSLLSSSSRRVGPSSCVDYWFLQQCLLQSWFYIQDQEDDTGRYTVDNTGRYTLYNTGRYTARKILADINQNSRKNSYQ